MYETVHYSKGDIIMNTYLREYNLIHSGMVSAYHEAALKLGISDTAMDILYAICEDGDGINQSILYKKTGIKKSTVNSALHKMQSNGMIELRSGEGRNIKVFLTKAGAHWYP